MVTEKQIANLKPVQKGEVGRNPNGRPKGAQSSKTILKKLLSLEVEIEKKDGTKKTIVPENEIWETAVVQAMAGDKDARRDIYDRLEGKPVQTNINTDVPATPEQKAQQIQNEIDALLNGEEIENVESEAANNEFS